MNWREGAVALGIVQEREDSCGGRSRMKGCVGLVRKQHTVHLAPRIRFRQNKSHRELARGHRNNHLMAAGDQGCPFLRVRTGFVRAVCGWLGRV